MSTIDAANHSGDTDSTAAIAGNIMGALLGADAIPGRWLRHGRELHTNIGCHDVRAELARVFIEGDVDADHGVGERLNRDRLPVAGEVPPPRARRLESFEKARANPPHLLRHVTATPR